MPNLSPLITSRADNTNLYAPVESASYPSGIANGLTWATYGSGTYASYITVEGVNANSVVQATLSVPQSNITDAVNCWLVSSFATNGSTIVFIVANNPSTASNFPISWQVVKP